MNYGSMKAYMREQSEQQKEVSLLKERIAKLEADIKKALRDHRHDKDCGVHSSLGICDCWKAGFRETLEGEV